MELNMRRSDIYYKAIFSDVDGTLLTSSQQITRLTRVAISRLQEKGIPFVIVSGRSPSGIYSILNEYDICCPIISYNGGLILDEKRNTLYQWGIDQQRAGMIINYIEAERFDLSWNIYSQDEWLVKDKQDDRIIFEENEVKAQAKQGSIDSLPVGAKVNKILCICNPEKILDIEEKMTKRFPDCSIVKSSETLLEVMEYGVTKAKAVRTLCDFWGIDIRDTIAFGDNYNDVDMLEAVGYGVVMGNAPEEIKKKIGRVTLDHDHDGIYHALAELQVIKI